jgi:succinate dehydrogenase hydrophobic anchor subunit
MAIKSKRYQEARLEASTNLELYWWVFMRISGVVLVFLLIGHMWMNAILTDLNKINYDYVAQRLSQTTWKIYDWLILALGSATSWTTGSGTRPSGFGPRWWSTASSPSSSPWGASAFLTTISG